MEDLWMICGYCEHEWKAGPDREYCPWCEQPDEGEHVIIDYSDPELDT